MKYFFKILYVLASGWFLTGNASAAQEGTCYQRSYDAAHLSAHPAQVVRQISVYVFRDPQTQVLTARLRVVSTNQGAVRGTEMAGKVFSQYAYCDSADARTCWIPIDGGGEMRIEKRTGEQMIFSTRRLAVELEGVDYIDGIDLAEKPEQETRYLLYAAPLAQCGQ